MVRVCAQCERPFGRQTLIYKAIAKVDINIATKKKHQYLAHLENCYFNRTQIFHLIVDHYR